MSIPFFPIPEYRIDPIRLSGKTTNGSAIRHRGVTIRIQ